MKLFRYLIVLISVGIGLGIAQEITLRAADVQPDDYPTVLGLKTMASYLAENSDGRISLEIFSGGQLGDERSTIEQAQLGIIDIVRVSSSPVGEFYTPMGVFSLPYIFRDQAHFVKVLEGPVGEELLAGLTEAGLVGLAYYDSGSRNFYTTETPIRGVEDLQGLRMRTQQSQVVLDMMEILGAEPVPMAFGEVYSSLQTGVIDGAENNYPSYGPNGVRHFEVAPYFTEDGHSRIPEVVMIAQSTWDRLSAEDQQMMRDAAAASVPVQFAAWAELSDASKQAVLGAGSEIIEVDTQAFQDAVQPLYETYGSVYGDILERILDTE